MTGAAVLVISEVMLMDCLFDDLDRAGILGTTGTKGNAFPEIRPFEEGTIFESGRNGIWGAVADDGVVGCVELVSEGAFDVVGVAESERGIGAAAKY